MFVPAAIATFGAGAFPEINGVGGDSLKTAYQSGATTGGAGTYTRDYNGTVWAKQGELAFEFITTGTNIGTYRVRKGTVTGGAVFIPSTYNDGTNGQAAVTEIGSASDTYTAGAFYGCTSLTSVTFAPDSQLTSIGREAFSYCTSLGGINIPAGVTSIGYEAFNNCTSLTGVTFASGSQLTSIGESAFNSCNFTDIIIPSSVTSIGGGAFSNCNNLTSITLPFVDSNISLKVPASLKTVTITGGSSIPDYAFYEFTGITSVSIPDSVTSIGNNAFYGCTGLNGITIPYSVTSIGNNAFYGCTGLISVVFATGSNITSFGTSAFPEETSDGGDSLMAAYQRTDPPVGGAGTYTRTSYTVWAKQ